MKRIMLLLFFASTSTAHYLSVEVSAGELLDKQTILEIKLERIIDPHKIENIQTELRSVMETVNTHIPSSPELIELVARLLEVNKELWDIEDLIRDKEAKKEFDQEFIELARSVYFTNDIRAKIKRAINELLGSHLVEEKSYKKYAAAE